MQSVHLQLPADLLARVDEAAGDVPRNRWIRRAIERELGDIGRVDRAARAYVSGELAAVAPAESHKRWEILVDALDQDS